MIRFDSILRLLPNSNAVLFAGRADTHSSSGKLSDDRSTKSTNHNTNTCNGAIMRTFTHRIATLGIALCIVSLFIDIANAQPSLNFLRIKRSWPTIELYFRAECNGQPLQTLQQNNITVKDNGKEIQSFAVSCPDPTADFRISTALVFDASGSMMGSGNAGAIAGGNRFVDLMDGIVDEAAVIWFTSIVTTQQSMTSDKSSLHTAVNALPSNGATACWDGIYTGLQEVKNNANNPVKAVIAMTDGGDNSSNHTPQDVILFASMNNIRVYTIGLGGVLPDNLILIAEQTGGVYYGVATPQDLPAVYEEILTNLRKSGQECMISYQADCPDGGAHTVELDIHGVCGGSDLKSRNYLAPLDTTAFTTVLIDGGYVAGPSGQDVLVPIAPRDNGSYWFAPFTVDFTFDPAVCTYVSLEQTGTALEGKPADAVAIQNGVKIRSFDYTGVSNGQPLVYVKLHINSAPLPAYVTPLQLDGWHFADGCLIPVLSDGRLEVNSGITPFVIPSGTTILCEDDSIKLECIDGFKDYLWSTGETTKAIFVDSSGTFWLDATDAFGGRSRSNIVTVTVKPHPKPRLNQPTDLRKCDTAEVECLDNYVEYHWSNGMKTKYASLAAPGTYYLTVLDSNGCWGVSDTIHVTKKSPIYVSITGAEYICDTSAVYTYSVAQNSNFVYTWFCTNGTFVGPTNTNTVEVKWGLIQSGEVYVLVEEIGTGCRTQERVIVHGETYKPRLNLHGTIALCDGVVPKLNIVTVAQTYQWSNGSTDSVLYITQPGVYYCYATMNGCPGWTDTLTVVRLDSAYLNLKGPQLVCPFSTKEYTVTTIPGATYTWTITGGELINIMNSPKREVSWKTVISGTVDVVVNLNNCTARASLPVTIHPYEIPDLTLTGDSIFCEGDSAILTAEDGFVKYYWSTGDSTKSIVVTTPGRYYVSVVNAAGCESMSKAIFIHVKARPAKPVITFEINSGTLTCSADGVLYQWYKDGQALPGETGKTCQVTGNGSYTVVVSSIPGCSTESDPHVVTGVESLSPQMVRLFTLSPNPASGNVNIDIQLNAPSAFTLKMFDISGRIVYAERQGRPVQSYRRHLQVWDMPSGVYFLTIESVNLFERRMLIIQNR